MDNVGLSPLYLSSLHGSLSHPRNVGPLPLSDVLPWFWGDDRFGEYEAQGESSSADVASSFVQGTRGQTHSWGKCPVTLAGPDLVICCKPHPPKKVPLLLAEVSCHCTGFSVRPILLVVLSGPSSDSGNEHAENLEVNMNCDVWIIEVDGDEAAARRVLFQMGILGAIREGLHSQYALNAEVIGTGSHGSVHRADVIGDYGVQFVPEHSKDAAVAVKLILPAGCSPDTPQTEKALFSEVALLARAQSHPNIVGFLGFYALEDDGEDENNPQWALVMDYYPGGDLFERITKCGLYCSSEAARLMRKLLSALAHLHRRGIVHRDVKCENVLLTHDMSPVLADFGIASFLSDHDNMKRRCGSPGYAAPEVLHGNPYTEKIDVFGAGAALYFVLTGQSPFRGDDLPSILRKNLRGVVKFRKSDDSVAESPKAFVKLLMQKNAEDRPNAEQAIDHLENHYKEFRLPIVFPRNSSSRTASICSMSSQFKPSEKPGQTDHSRILQDSQERKARVSGGQSADVLPSDAALTGPTALPPMRPNDIMPFKSPRGAVEIPGSLPCLLGSISSERFGKSAQKVVPAATPPPVSSQGLCAENVCSDLKVESRFAADDRTSSQHLSWGSCATTATDDSLISPRSICSPGRFSRSFVSDEASNWGGSPGIVPAGTVSKWGRVDASDAISLRGIMCGRQTEMPFQAAMSDGVDLVAVALPPMTPPTAPTAKKALRMVEGTANRPCVRRMRAGCSASF